MEVVNHYQKRRARKPNITRLSFTKNFLSKTALTTSELFLNCRPTLETPNMNSNKDQAPEHSTLQCKQVSPSKQSQRQLKKQKSASKTKTKNHPQQR